jgi:hypothetical protein
MGKSAERISAKVAVPQTNVPKQVEDFAYKCIIRNGFWKRQGCMSKMGSDFLSFGKQKLSLECRLEPGDKAEWMILPSPEKK